MWAVKVGMVALILMGPSAYADHPAIVRVEVKLQDGKCQLGTGSLVSLSHNLGWIITNHHVTEGDRKDVTVRFRDGRRFYALVIREDTVWDLSLLAIAPPDVKPIRFGRVPKLGDRISINGYGQGSFRQATGYFKSKGSPEPKETPWDILCVSTTARQGDSGGPMLNNKGELVGVLNATGGGWTVGCNVTQVRRFLAEGTDYDDSR